MPEFKAARMSMALHIQHEVIISFDSGHVDNRPIHIAPDQKVSDVPVRQIGPGSYAAVASLAQKGTFTFRAIADQASGPSRVLPYSYPDEYHFYPPNTDLLPLHCHRNQWRVPTERIGYIPNARRNDSPANTTLAVFSSRCPAALYK